MSDRLLHLIALTLVPQIGPVQARLLLQHLPPEEIFRAKQHQLQRIEGVGPERARSILRFKDFARAEKEIRFLEKTKIRALSMDDPLYPQRLLHCYDPPVLLYYAGAADLNRSRHLAIIGTRLPTERGQTWTERIVEELAGSGVSIISGLASGIDAIAHRAALKHGLLTVGVLAHGLDRIYPYAHRKLAAEMESTGGLLTEFLQGTQPDRYHFPARNRLVAGLTDATLVIESGEKGGSLITASLANQYYRDVFALPGRLEDERSMGCLKLIKQHQAALFTSTTDLLEQLGWTNTQTIPSVTALQLFPELNADESQVIELLQKEDILHQDQIGWALGMPTAKLNSCLLQLEMKGLVLSLPGKTYRLKK